VFVGFVLLCLFWFCISVIFLDKKIGDNRWCGLEVREVAIRDTLFFCINVWLIFFEPMFWGIPFRLCSWLWVITGLNPWQLEEYMHTFHEIGNIPFFLTIFLNNKIVLIISSNSKQGHRCSSNNLLFWGIHKFGWNLCPREMFNGR